MSRICNEDVMRTAKCSDLCSHVFFRQFILFGRDANVFSNDVLRQTVFEDDCFEIKSNYGTNRGKGRPTLN